MTTRELDLYALRPESVPQELRDAPLVDRGGRALAVGDVVRLPRHGECRIVGREGAWVYLDMDTDPDSGEGEPGVAFITEIAEGERRPER